ncbi:MAG TPA: type II secretion system F family protein [Opitutales bacterium]|nr:type II secretion system F family protein [Opitutales bacterium]
MPKYRYSAIDSSGSQKTGKIEASSPDEANAKLSQQGLMVASLTAEGEKPGKAGKAGKKGGGMKFGRVITPENLAVFTRQMATLLQAGLPLLRSLEVMIRQEKNARFRDVLVALADNVRSGNNLSDGMLQHPKVFDRLYINMVKAGEAGGVLDVVLSRLARFMEKSVKTNKKIKSAMVYPAVVVSVAFIIVALLMAFVVPRFQKIFQDMLHTDKLPWLTDKVVMLSKMMTPSSWTRGIIDVGVLVGGFLAIRFFLKSKIGSAITDRVILKLPKIGDFARKANVARFTRTFGTLMSSGVPILQALTITRDIVQNSVIAKALDRVHDRVRDGEPLAAPLEQQKVFPTMVTSMIDVGEETGELPEMLNRIADNYDEDLDNAVAGLTSIIEPVMIVFLALVVGTIVIALFLPIIDIIKNMASGHTG